MAKIVLEINDHQASQTRYQIVDGEAVKIGRAFNNDVIINDSFVDAHHVTLHMTSLGWECVDLGSVNGTFLATNSQEPLRIDQPSKLESGSILTIGKSTIRVWDSQHPVSPALKINVNTQEDSLDLRKTVWRPIAALVMFFIFYYVILFISSLQDPASFLLIISFEVAFVLILAIWAGLWALITRFTKQRHLFFQHLMAVCLYSMLYSILSIISLCINFYVCNSLFLFGSNVFMFGLIGGLVLYKHLTIATNDSSRKRLIITSGIIIPLILMVIFAYVGRSREFNANPKHYMNVLPLPTQLIPTVPIDKFITQMDAVFQP